MAQQQQQPVTEKCGLLSNPLRRASINCAIELCAGWLLAMIKKIRQL
jgi:hypothetical protein